MKLFLSLLHKWVAGPVLKKPAMREALSAYSNDMLFAVQDPGNLIKVEVSNPSTKWPPLPRTTGSRALT